MDDAKMEHARKVLREINQFIEQRYGANDTELVGGSLMERRRAEAEEFGELAKLFFRRSPCEVRKIAVERKLAHAAADTEAETQPTSLREQMEQDGRDFQRECDQRRKELLGRF